MEPGAYRTPCKDEAPVQEAERPSLGALRSSHPSLTLARKLLPVAFAGAFMLLSLLSTSVGAHWDLRVLAIGAVIVIVLVAVMAAWSARGGRYTVELHEHGLVTVFSRLVRENARTLDVDDELASEN